jgi:hypothetical protein
VISKATVGASPFCANVTGNVSRTKRTPRALFFMTFLLEQIRDSIQEQIRIPIQAFDRIQRL